MEKSKELIDAILDVEAEMIIRRLKYPQYSPYTTRIPIPTVKPEPPITGSLYYDASISQAFMYDGANWVQVRNG